MDKKEGKTFMNVYIDKTLIIKAKTKSALLGIALTAFIERLIEENTKDIKFDKSLQNEIKN